MAWFYINCVLSVGHYWERTGMGDVLYLNMKTIKEEAKYQEAFLYTSVKKVRWALDIYQNIVLQNLRKPKEES